MKKAQSFLNGGETLKELMYNSKEAFPTNAAFKVKVNGEIQNCLLYTSPSPRDRQKSRMPSSA